MQTVDVAYAEEWKFDHGISVPLHFLTPDYDLPIVPANINCQGPPLTPLKRAWAFGEALRAAADAVPERIALVATGGISHWPATPDSGKINEKWDREFLEARAASRSAPSLPPPRRPRAPKARSSSANRCRSLPSAAPWPGCRWWPRTYSVRPESAGRNMLAATNIARARISAQMEPRRRADGISANHAGAVPSERKSL